MAVEGLAHLRDAQRAERADVQRGGLVGKVTPLPLALRSTPRTDEFVPDIRRAAA